MQAFRSFIRSPLARHPRLLGRKIASRLHLYREDVRVPGPPVSVVTYPSHWAPTLRSWIQQVPLKPVSYPFHRVFGQDFDETLLLRLCREGPRRDESGLKADIKLIWDYSRGHALFINAAAGLARLDECVAFVRRWLEANAHTNGPAWTCAMEVAIRAINWIFADTLFGGQLGQQLGSADWAACLWRHGYVIWRRLEARLISSNHYLADLLGLFIIGSVLPEESQAGAWLRFAQGEFPRALLAQTRRDGGLYEASLRYHAYVTEMALLFRLAQGSAFSHNAEARLRDMCRIVADFRDATGDVFPIGDDDSGRVLALDSASSAGQAEILLRLASLLLREEFKPSASAVYPDSGWWMQRAGDFVMALDFGGVGLRGIGAHAHNDDLSFCLDWRNQPVITDPGTFLYTGDPAARNRFRSTLFHNTLAVDDGEQRELNRSLFALPGSDAAFEANRLAENAWAFTRQVAPGVFHRREVSVRVDAVSVRDVIEGSGRHKLQWRFNLHPAVRPRMASQGFTLVVPGAGTLLLEVTGASPALEILPSEHSPAYGCSHPTHACAASGEFTLPLIVNWRIQPLD